MQISSMPMCAYNIQILVITIADASQTLATFGAGRMRNPASIRCFEENIGTSGQVAMQYSVLTSSMMAVYAFGTRWE